MPFRDSEMKRQRDDYVCNENLSDVPLLVSSTPT